MYRINDQSELEFLGWNDLFEDGMIIVEWPQRAPIVKNRSDIEFVFDFIETGRNIKIKSLSSNGESFLKVLKKKIQH